MPIIKKQILEKQQKMNYVKKNIDESSAVIFYNFSHADNNEIFFLKKKLRGVNSKWFVCKNILFKKALSDENLQINNNNAFVFCKGDQYEPLKILKNFNFKEGLERRIQGGIYDGNFIDYQTLTNWAGLKSREVLLGDFCNLLVFDIFRLVKLLEIINNK